MNSDDGSQLNNKHLSIDQAKKELEEDEAADQAMRRLIVESENDYRRLLLYAEIER